MSSADCGIEYSRIYAGPIIPTPNVSWGPLGSHYNIRCNVASTTRQPGSQANIRIHMNLIEGVCEKAIYHNASINGEVSDNVFSMPAATRCMLAGVWEQIPEQLGVAAELPVLGKNSRVGDPYDHGDFFQSYSSTVNMTDYTLIGNVYMMAGGNQTLNHPHQGIFGSQSRASGWLYENNIIMNNSAHGITITGETGGGISNMTALHNSVIRCIDMPGRGASTPRRFRSRAERAAAERAVKLRRQHVDGSSGLNIRGPHDQHTVPRLLHQPHMVVVFYDLRPVTGR